MTEKALTYSSYLRIDELLALQTPRSEGPEHDRPVIVIHQVYGSGSGSCSSSRRGCRRCSRPGTCRALHTLKRILTILKTIVAQVDILETMTPLSFASAGGSTRRRGSSRRSSASSRRCSAGATGGSSSSTRGRAGAQVPDRGGDGAPVAWDSFLRFLDTDKAGAREAI